MKSNVFRSAAQMLHIPYGESYGTIIRYVIPECVTAFVIYSLPLWVDAWFIAELKSTPGYATLGATNNVIHFLFKLAESLCVGTIIMAGSAHGRGAYQEVGESARDAFWCTTLLGMCAAAMLYCGAPSLYAWYGVSTEIAQLGVPYLKIRAWGVLFMFMYMALVGFLRAIKNSYLPMSTFIAGACLFLLADWVFIFGKWGMPALGLRGSAMACVFQYGVMVLILLCRLYGPEYRRYTLCLHKGIVSFAYIMRLARLSWPIMIDKATMAWSYIWLCKMIAPMGTCVIASFCALKDMERCAFLPAVACAQVITYLVSNDRGVQNWEGIYANVKKVCVIAACSIGLILIIFAMNPAPIIQFFDKKGDFTLLAVQAFPVVSVLVFCDLVQLILAAALRGTGNVRTVMYTRLFVCIGYFIPLSYLLSTMQISLFYKFVLIYGSFYVGNMLMGIMYIHAIRTGMLHRLKEEYDTNLSRRSA